MLARLAHFTARYRWPVIVVWIVLTLFGGVAAGKLSTRWYQSFSIPGKPAYEASQRTLQGVRRRRAAAERRRLPHASGDATKSPAMRAAMARAVEGEPGRADELVLLDRQPDVRRRSDRHTTFMQVYPPGRAEFDMKSGAEEMRAAAAAGLPAGITVDVTGHDPLEEATTHGGERRLRASSLEALIGGLGALVILLFVFGTLPAV